MSDPVALCAERLAAGDPDRFAAVMACPVSDRPALFALYAANLAIAQAPWASAEPLVAEMRLQWWIDALEALAAQGRPVPQEIGPALQALPEAALRGLITVAEARRVDCHGEAFADAARLWDYLDATSGALAAAAGACLGAGSEAALHAHGTAAGLANWLIALPELTARGRLTLAGAEPGLLADLARDGLTRLAATRGALRTAAPAARLAALSGWQAAAVLHRAAGAPERIAAGALRGSEFSRRLGLLRARLAV
ncbi:squalene/phytoene synthase family protein [Rhodobacter capsulatus]|uniref:squalene/phytoene synthase family protein n=1 Tax=Rhodobacter capsulatus TaxID=1061 RepID=UPI0006DC5C83|nr:squalene/phytoene synthase family protein [Rhodobacter capsulatus]KQB17219.1 hypothetical protein AP073_00850 [Rhodobacter capsulatus]KQB17619.1 hypothetical protein AP071_00855 [Rhodobacter capsulatus]PZX27397.1 squalene/phytoene synthase [Rhodobacter capsulatus]QNR64475.1 squalene/phytoene synthase family protein [Rhodobacter capsulatus]